MEVVYMSIFQIIAVCFALFMALTVSIHRKKKTLSELESSFWYCVWAGFICIAFFPTILNGVTGWLHFSRVFDLLIVCAFMVLSVLTFKNYFTYKRMEQRLESVVREIALKKPVEKHEKEVAKN
jgi:hypothetical protein